MKFPKGPAKPTPEPAAKALGMLTAAAAGDNKSYKAILAEFTCSDDLAFGLSAVAMALVGMVAGGTDRQPESVLQELALNLATA